jgi:predicted transposase YdaD
MYLFFNSRQTMISKDLLWKSIIEDFFFELMLFFYPEFQEQLDFSQVEFLDKEFRVLFPNSESGDRYADKLVKVKWKKGGELWLLIHIEVQGYEDVEFEERMFQYYYRIYEKHRIPIESLVIFTDPNPSFHPKKFQIRGLTTTLDFHFKTYKVIDQQEECVEKQDNPFALVVLTAFKAIRQRRFSGEHLFEQKIELFRKLLSRGYDQETIFKLFRFLKYYVSFSDHKAELKFDKELNVILKQNKTMGIIELEREYLINKGIEKSIEMLLINGRSVQEVVAWLEVPLEKVEKIRNYLLEEGKIKKK